MSRRRGKWDAIRLYDENSMEQLTELMKEVREDPENLNPVDDEGHPIGTIYLLNPAGRKKMDAITWAISWHLADRKA